MSRKDTVFPPELIDAFVDHIMPETVGVLHGNNFPILVKFTQISKSFAYAARRRIFSTIVIDRNGEAMSGMGRRSEDYLTCRINALVDILNDEKSDLVLHIRKLDIRVDVIRGGVEVAPNLDHLLVNLRDRASNLNTISLRSGRDLIWDHLSPRRRELIGDLCRSLPVTRLIFAYIFNIPPTFISPQQCPNLRSFEFATSAFAAQAVNKDGADAMPATRTRRPEIWKIFPRIGKYNIRYRSDGDVVVTAVDADFHRYDTAPFFIFLGYISKSVELITGFLRKGPLMPHLVHDLGTFTQLRQLVIKQYPSANDFKESMAKIFACLSCGSEKSSLKELSVFLWIEDRFDYQGSNTMAIVDFSALKGFRLELLRDKHPLIQRVDIHINIDLHFRKHESCAARAKEVEKRVRKQFFKAITSDMEAHRIPHRNSSLLPQLSVHVDYSLE